MVFGRSGVLVRVCISVLGFGVKQGGILGYRIWILGLRFCGLGLREEESAVWFLGLRSGGYWRGVFDLGKWGVGF